MKTLFQKIIDREIPADIEHEDDLCIVIRDIQPQAPVHLLVIPKKPIPRLAESADEDETVLGHLMLITRNMARKLELTEGFRVVINNGLHGCESVPHLHVHILGERQLQWPPG
ncbi:MAG: histidine triad nucleotide-binding protein [Verrucomicrobiia bacterium]|tara:strand:+ start:3276 stop:3614 length:339 start_codon:yes stop_codon:yes gene_type:complete